MCFIETPRVSRRKNSTQKIWGFPAQNATDTSIPWLDLIPCNTAEMIDGTYVQLIWINTGRIYTTRNQQQNGCMCKSSGQRKLIFQAPSFLCYVTFSMGSGLVVEPTHLKNMQPSKLGIFSPSFGVSIKNLWVATTLNICWVHPPAQDASHLFPMRDYILKIKPLFLPRWHPRLGGRVQKIWR